MLFNVTLKTALVNNRKEVASGITLRNAHKENKRAKSECSFVHLAYSFFF